MAKIIKNIQVAWSWSGDTYALKGFNIMVLPSGQTPTSGSINAVASARISPENRSYSFNNTTLDTGVTYVAWVQAYYEDGDSQWTNNASFSVADDGLNTIPTKGEATSIATTKADSALSSAQTYASTQATTALNSAKSYTTTVVGNTRTNGLGIKVDYSGFSAPNDGEIYLHGFNTEGVATDSDGWVMWNGAKVTVTKGMINPNNILPFNIPIYFVWSTLSSVTLLTFYDTVSKKWKYSTMSPTAIGGDMSWADGHIVLGQFTMTSGETLTGAVLYQTPKHYSEIVISSEAATYAATQATSALDSAKAYADAQLALEEARANAYADGVVTAEEAARLSALSTNLAEAKAYAETQANSAKTTAISTAAADATSKANTAQTTAISTAATDATNKANTALSSAQTYANAGNLFIRGTGMNRSSNRVVEMSGVSIHNGTGRGMRLITFNRSTLAKVEDILYDTYGLDADRAALATKLDSLTDSVIVTLTSWDAIGWSAALLTAIQRFGGTGYDTGTGRTPFAFVGIAGMPRGTALEVRTGLLATDPYAEISTKIINGMPQGINSAVTTAITTADSAKSTANTAASTATTASTNASAAVSTANTANSTANTASTNASAAVSTANTASTNATNAVNTANTANTNAANAVSTANTAASNASSALSTANTANTAVADMSNDNKLTPIEKQDTQKEWDVIKGEYSGILAEGTRFAVSTATFTTEYDALDAYITPLLTSLTTTSDITGTTFRAKFKAYYDARQVLLNAISAKAKTIADGAVSTANTANTAASNAVSTANTASSTASTASTNASNAVTTANSAASSASTALSTANTANSTASTASTNASSAVSTANSAVSTANTAVSTANTAKSSIDNLTIGSTNIIRKSAIVPNSVASSSFDEATNTWTLTAANGAGGTWGAGLRLNGTTVVIPLKSWYTLSFEIWSPVDTTWNLDVNNYAVAGVTAWTAGNDNDNGGLRSTSTKTVKANTWTKCWSTISNSHASATGDIYDNSNFGIANNTGADVTFKIRNVQGELGNRPTDWSANPYDLEQAYTAVALAKAALAETQANAYADGQVSAEEAARIAEATAKLTEAKNYAASQASTAQSTAISTAASDATSKANTAQATAISTAASDATAKANAAQTTAISTAASDATTKANNALSSAQTYADGVAQAKAALAETTAKAYADGVVDAEETARINEAKANLKLSVEAGTLNRNPIFTEWGGTHANFPSYMTYWSTTAFGIKETAITKNGGFGLRFKNTGTTQCGATMNGYFKPNLAPVKYVMIEVDFYLVSGSPASAGVLLDWQGMSTYRRQYQLSEMVPETIVTGKWYTAKKIFKRPSDTTTGFTGLGGYLMASYSSLATAVEKDIIYDRFVAREATQEEIDLFEKQGSWDAAGTNASAAVNTANTAASNASTAVSTANSASSTASTALSTANTANSTASTASANASSAVSTANSAASTASTASSTASTALNTANTAKSTVDNMEIGGRNLVVRSGELTDKLIDTSGNISSGTGSAVMDSYIAVSAGETYTFTKDNIDYWRWKWLDGSYAYISRTANNSNSFQWTVPSGASFVQVSYPTNANVKIEKGNKATAWTPSIEDVEAAYVAVAEAKAALAETQAKSYADGQVSAEESARIAEATAKLTEAKNYAASQASSAQSAAISSAATDATSKANTAQTAAVSAARLETYKKTHLAVRYIRDWVNGSSANTSSHWYEIQAFSNSSNVAQGKTVSTNGTGTNLTYVVDNNTGGTYASAGAGLVYVQVDLGSIYYDIDEVKVWRYWNDGRTYNETKTEVSSDGTNWYPIFDSLIQGKYAETSAGKSFAPTIAKTESLFSAKLAREQALAYADGVISTEEQARIDAVTASLNSAKSYAESQATAAQTTAISTAAADATAKANAAIDEAKRTIPLVIGTQTTTTGAWTGVANFDSLVDGQQINYWLPTSGSGNATLNLTLSGGGTTGAINCYYGGTSRLTTHYGAGNAIQMTYRLNAMIGGTAYTGWWASSNYADGNTYDRTRYNQAMKATEAITGGQLVVGNTGGFYKIMAGRTFDVTKPILYAQTTLALNATGTDNYSVFPSCNLQTTIAGTTLTSGKVVYLRGSLSGTNFTIHASNVFTDTPTDDGVSTYLVLGQLYSAYQILLYAEHPMFKFVDGVFKSFAQIAAEALSNASTAVSTANNASANASTAISTANTASSAASTAVSTANTANSTASTAASNASAAVSTANSASSTANTAASNASAAVSTANSASSKVDNLAIGGRNIFRTSGNFGATVTNWANNGGGLTVSTTEKWNGWNTIQTTVGAGISGNWYKLENGVEYTFSAMIKSSEAYTGNGSTPLHYHAGLNNVNQGKIQVISYDTSYLAGDAGKYKLMHIVFKLTGDGDSFRPFIYVGSGTRVFNIAYMKLEKGNKPTDWSPATEDVDEFINTKADGSTTRDSLDGLSTQVGSALAGLNDKADVAAFNQWVSNVTALDEYAKTVKRGLDAGLIEIENIKTFMTFDIADMQLYYNAINQYMSYSEANGLLLGAKNDSVKLRFKNNIIEFVDGTTQVAYIDNMKMKITQADFTNGLEVGNHKIERLAGSEEFTVFTWVGSN